MGKILAAISFLALWLRSLLCSQGRRRHQSIVAIRITRILVYPLPRTLIARAAEETDRFTSRAP